MPRWGPGRSRASLGARMDIWRQQQEEEEEKEAGGAGASWAGCDPAPPPPPQETPGPSHPRCGSPGWRSCGTWTAASCPRPAPDPDPPHGRRLRGAAGARGAPAAAAAASHMQRAAGPSERAWQRRCHVTPPPARAASRPEPSRAGPGAGGGEGKGGEGGDPPFKAGRRRRAEKSLRHSQLHLRPTPLDAHWAARCVTAGSPRCGLVGEGARGGEGGAAPTIGSVQNRGGVALGEGIGGAAHARAGAVVTVGAVATRPVSHALRHVTSMAQFKPRTCGVPLPPRMAGPSHTLRVTATFFL